MSPVEQRLRGTIDRLRFERDCRDLLIEDLRAKLNREQVRAPARRCVYCGDRCYGPACVLHRDLLELDTAVHA